MVDDGTNSTDTKVVRNLERSSKTYELRVVIQPFVQKSIFSNFWLKYLSYVKIFNGKVARNHIMNITTSSKQLFDLVFVPSYLWARNITFLCFSFIVRVTSIYKMAGVPPVGTPAKGGSRGALSPLSMNVYWNHEIKLLNCHIKNHAPYKRII